MLRAHHSYRTTRSERPARSGRARALGLATLALLAAGGAGLFTVGAGTAAAAAKHRSTAHTTASVTWPAAQWSTRTTTGSSVGHIAQSSPTTARVGNRTILAVGAENGYVYVMNARTGQELPGWPQRVSDPGGQPVAIESSPTIAWLDGRGHAPSIIVGTGSTWVTSTVGEVEAFALDGKPRFVFHVGAAAGTAIGVISSPAVGDLTGNGQEDIVFGSWDHDIYALNSDGQVLPGFPYNNADTVWSSPALYRLPGRTSDDIFIGSDASGRDGCTGGFVGDYRYVAGAVKTVWIHCENQTIWSSPAVGVINSSGRPAVVVGTGFYEQPFPSTTDEVLAYYADNGATVPGWPVHTDGPALGSPAIGVIDASGKPSVVETSWVCGGPMQKDCFSSNASRVSAWTGSGQLIWSQEIQGPTSFSSPVLVPLLDHTTNDVLVGSPSGGLYPMDGATGAFLYGTDGADAFAAINPGCHVFNSVAVADVGGTGPRSGWHVFEACGGPAQFNFPGEVVSYRLPVQPDTVSGLWPMFHESPEHDGVAGEAEVGSPTVTAAATAALARSRARHRALS